MKEAILDVGATWKVETLRKYADPEILEGSNLDKTQKFLDLYSHKLGKLQNLGLLSLSQADRNPGRDKTKGFAFEYFGDAKFAKDEGRIVVVVINNKGVWKVVGITVFSKALGNEKNAPSATPPPFSK